MFLLFFNPPYNSTMNPPTSSQVTFPPSPPFLKSTIPGPNDMKPANERSSDDARFDPSLSSPSINSFEWWGLFNSWSLDQSQ